MKAVHVLAVIGGVALAGVAARFYFQQPSANIVINKDGTGTATLGAKSGAFTHGEGLVLTAPMGWTLNASATNYSLRQFGKVFQSGEIGNFGADQSGSRVNIYRNS